MMMGVGLVVLYIRVGSFLNIQISPRGFYHVDFIYILNEVAALKILFLLATNSNHIGNNFLSGATGYS